MVCAYEPGRREGEGVEVEFSGREQDEEGADGEEAEGEGCLGAGEVGAGGGGGGGEGRGLGCGHLGGWLRGCARLWIGGDDGVGVRWQERLERGSVLETGL